MGRWMRRVDVWVWAAAVYALVAALAPFLPAGGGPATQPGAPAEPPQVSVPAPSEEPPLLGRLDTPILRYRGVANGGGGAAVPLARLEEHLQTLRAGGFEAVGLGQVLAALHDDAPLPRRAVALAFDAGQATTVALALPALTERHIRATFFVEPQQVGQPGAPSAAQVRSLAAAGMDLAPLARLYRTPAGTSVPDALGEQLLALRGRLLGLGVTPLPLAALTVPAPDQEQVRALAMAGYQAAVTLRPGAGLDAVRPFELPVTLMEGDVSVEALRQAVRGPEGEPAP